MARPTVRHGMYDVLVPVDADRDRARAQATFVAELPFEQDEVDVRLLYVFGGSDDEDLPEELRQFKNADRIGSVREARSILEEAGYAVTVLDDSGDPAASILGVADDIEADLIVLGGRHRSPVGKALFGSVAQKVILEGSIPVTVTGAGP